MQNEKNKVGILAGLYYVPFFAAVLAVFSGLQPINSGLGWLMGHDYAHYFVRLSIGMDHFWKNGWKVPHFTSRLCGGIPFFADPQSIYYSLQQYLAFFIPPLAATQLTYLIFYLIGWMGMIVLCHSVFKFSKGVSHFAALLFVLNGFTFAHLLVGHVTHYTFLLIPWLYFAVLSSSKKILRNTVIFSGIVTYFIYSGSIHVLVVSLLSLFLLIPYLLHKKKKDGLIYLTKLSLYSLVFLLLAASGKVIANLLMSKNLHVHGVDSPSESALSLFLQYFWFLPEKTPETMRFGHWAFGSWEFVGYISKITIPLIILYLVFRVIQFYRKQISALLFFTTVVLSVAVVLLALGRLGNNLIPLFKHYHNPLKILAAFIPLIIIVSAQGLQDLAGLNVIKRIRPIFLMAIYLVVGFGLVVEYSHYTDFFVRNRMTMGFVYNRKLFRDFHQYKELPAVNKIDKNKYDDYHAIFSGRSSISCYEPMFGYRLEDMKTQLMAGEVFQKKEGYFNINNPACFLYGDINGCKPWDRISVTEEKSMLSFINAGTETDWVPTWHSALIYFNFTFIGGLIIYFTVQWALHIASLIPIKKYVIAQKAEQIS